MSEINSLTQDIFSLANQASDYLAVDNVYLPDNIVSLSEPPRLFDLMATPNPLTDGLTASVFSLRVPGTQTMDVTAMVIPPDFKADSVFSNWVEFDTFDLIDSDGDGVYVGSYGKFLRKGEYAVVVD
ncbi:MAG: hypothetical protein COA80_05300, partial [Leeuwenhoekiella sp.]